MNPERQEAYLNLIDQVLSAPEGQEPQVLAQNSELVDAGLVQTLLQVSAALAHEGDENTAGFLVELARLLAKSLGLTPDLGDAASVQTNA